jgi:hypothetical protein
MSWSAIALAVFFALAGLLHQGASPAAKWNSDYKDPSAPLVLPLAGSGLDPWGG